MSTQFCDVFSRMVFLTYPQSGFKFSFLNNMAVNKGGSASLRFCRRIFGVSEMWFAQIVEAG